MPELVPQREVLFNRLPLGNVGVGDCSSATSTMKTERSHQLFLQRRLVLLHLFACQAHVRHKDYLQPGLGNVLSALLTPPVLRSLQLDECPVDRLDLGLYAFIQGSN